MGALALAPVFFGCIALTEDLIQMCRMLKTIETRKTPLISFVGVTGAGKSTLVRKVTRLNFL